MSEVPEFVNHWEFKSQNLCSAFVVLVVTCVQEMTEVRMGSEEGGEVLKNFLVFDSRLYFFERLNSVTSKTFK